MGISSRPPREFSLTSAGTKRPGQVRYLWAAKLDPRTLYLILRTAIAADHYPESQEALKVAALLPRDRAKSLFNLVEDSSKKSVKKTAKKLEPVLRARAKKYEVLKDILCSISKLIYALGEGIKEVNLDLVNEGTFDEILQSLLDGRKENRLVFKAAELLVFGRGVTLINFSAVDGPEADDGDALSPSLKLPSQ
jgi:hypothetical protein